MATKTKTPTAMTGPEIKSHIGTVFLGAQRRADEIIDQLNTRMQTELLPHTRPAAIDASALVERLMAGDQYDPVAVGVEVRDNEAHAAAARGELETLQRAVKSLHTLRNRAPADASADVLAFLREQLAGVITETAALAQEHPSTVSMQRAMDDGAGLLDAARDQTRLAVAYRTIRAAQRNTYRAIVGGNGAPGGDVHAVAQSGLLRDSFDSEQYWIQRRRNIADDRKRMDRERMGNGEHVQRFTNVKDIPFPATISGANFPGSDCWEYLSWASRNAEPWVPTLDELSEAHRNNKDKLLPRHTPSGGMNGMRRAARRAIA